MLKDEIGKIKNNIIEAQRLLIESTQKLSEMEESHVKFDNKRSEQKNRLTFNSLEKDIITKFKNNNKVMSKHLIGNYKTTVELSDKNSINDKKMGLVKISKNYKSDSNNRWNSYFTIYKKELEDYRIKIFIFAIKTNDDVELFIFSRNDMQDYLKARSPLEDENNIRCYMNAKNNGAMLEERQNKQIDISKYYNNFDAV